MTRTGKLLAALLALDAMLAGGLWIQKTQFSPAARLAKLPPAEQNRIITDAAIQLLRSNYYDPTLFETPGWSEFEAEWRQKSADYPGRGVWFYANVLDNIAMGFPESHLHFEAPASGMVPPPGPKPAPANAAGPSHARPALDLATAGSGFEYATIRRGAYRRDVITDVLRGTPADRAGITPGWVVARWSLTADDTGIHYKASLLTLAEPDVRELERSGLPLASPSQQQIDEFVSAHSLERAFDYERIPPRSDFDEHELANGATYLRFDSFNDWRLVSRAIDAIDAAGPGGLVLDLRRNSGGLMLHMMRVNGRLLGGGVELGRVRGRQSSETMNSLEIGNGHYTGPLVVLIGPGTASAAEITAACVQYYERGVLIGRTTSGSVISAQNFTLPDGGTMTIPTKDFVRPDQRRIEAVGVEPDIWILPTLSDVRAGRDPVLERAVRELQR